jgi:DNA-directed RNA polymerase subunit RPC12/RpoP
MAEEQKEVEDIVPEHRIYKCPQCRSVLFGSEDIILHEATKVRKFAGKRQKDSEGQDCQSFFIQKPEWLNALGRKSGSIHCPKCNYKIGHFSWVGSQCSCGEWVKPSFQVPKSRVDPI